MAAEATADGLRAIALAVSEPGGQDAPGAGSEQFRPGRSRSTPFPNRTKLSGSQPRYALDVLSLQIPWSEEVGLFWLVLLIVWFIVVQVVHRYLPQNQCLLMC